MQTEPPPSQKMLNAWRQGQARMHQMVQHADPRLMRAVRITFRVLLAVYFVFCALFLSVRYVVLPQVSQYKPQIEKRLSEEAGRQISISRIEASWYGLQPLLKLDDVSVHDAEGEVVLRLPQVKAALSWMSFFVFDLRLALLEISQPEIDIRRDKEGHLYVAGLPVDFQANEKGRGMEWLLRQHEIVIRDGVLRWRDELRDAPELVMKDLNFALENSGRHHRMRFLGHTGMAQPEAIDIRARFVHPFFAERLSDVSQWKGLLYVEIPAVDLEQWKPYVDFPLGLSSGAGAVQAWLAFDRGRVADLTVNVDWRNVMLQMQPDLPVLDLIHISGRISAKEFFEDASDESRSLGERPHMIDLRDIDLETADGIKMESVDFSERYTPAKKNKPESMEITADDLDISTMIQLAKYFPLTEIQHKMLDDFSPSGRLHDFTLRWEGQYPDISSYRVNGKFIGLSMNAVKGKPLQPKTAQSPAKPAIPAIPGFKNLTGSISANEYGGTLELNAEAASLDLPSYFPEADWKFDALKLLANWSQTAKTPFVFVVEKMDFTLNGISASASGKYTRPVADDTKHFGAVDMTATMKSFDMTKTGTYVPLAADDDLRLWLGKAFERGTASDIVVRLKGDLSDFPFTSKASKGEFSVRMGVNDVRLNYAPTMLSKKGQLLWQPIEKINGTMTIKGGQIAIHADTALLSGAALSNVDAVIPDMLAKEAMLNITGYADGDLQHFIQFVNGSPVNEVIGGLTEDAKTAGKARLLLKMQMPLSHMANSKVQGTVQFSENNIHLFPDLPVLTGVRGKVNFSDQGFDLQGVQAQFLGGKVSLSGGTAKDGRTQVKASGTLTADGLRKNYAGGGMGTLMGRFSGSMPYTLSIAQKDKSSGGYPDIVWESGMKGFGIDLPAPLGKVATETRTLRVTAKALPSSGKTRRDELRIAYGESAFAHYERQKTGNTWQLSRGGIGVNMKPELQQGVSLNVSMQQLDLNVWRDALESLFAGSDQPRKKTAPKEDSGMVQYVDPQRFFIQADRLSVLDFKLSKARVTGVRQAKRLHTEIDSHEMKGKLTWLEPTGDHLIGKLTARLEKLTIPRSGKGQVEDIIKRDKVRQIPALDMVAENFILFDLKLGRLELVANNVTGPSGKEWRIERLSVTNPDGRLSSSGKWDIENTGAQRTRMNYELSINDAGKLLDRFGYKDILKGGKGKMSGDIHWAGLPYSLDIPSLSGQIQMDIGKGQFLKVEPGVAKLLGVLSMQSLPRRLTLDFRDIFSDGFAFDEITARVEVSKGVAKTENLTMRGVTATVLMDGSVDIARETQNLHVAILPEINAGLASLAYGLINPAIGVGSFLAQLFLKAPLSKAFTYEYQITGSWMEPNIKKIKSKGSQEERTAESGSSKE